MSWWSRWRSSREPAERTAPQVRGIAPDGLPYPPSGQESPLTLSQLVAIWDKYGADNFHSNLSNIDQAIRQSMWRQRQMSRTEARRNDFYRIEPNTPCLLYTSDAADE